MKKPVAILGGGPAGLSCSLWLKQFHFAPVVIEQRPRVGGIQQTNHFYNRFYLGLIGHSGQEVAAQFARHAEAEEITSLLGVRLESITKAGDTFAVQVSGTRILAHALVVATGSRVKGSEALSSIQADWPQLSEQVLFHPGQTPVLAQQVQGKVVAVVGGGDNAMITALRMCEHNAHVHLVARRPLHGFKFNRMGIQGMEQDGCLTVHQPTEIRSLERIGGRIRLAFESAGGIAETLLVDYVCFRLGFSPNTEDVNHCLQRGGLDCLALTPGGHIVTDPFLRTSIPRIYAAGDVTNVRDACVATAVAQGAIAARSVEEAV